MMNIAKAQAAELKQIIDQHSVFIRRAVSIRADTPIADKPRIIASPLIHTDHDIGVAYVYCQ